MKKSRFTDSQIIAALKQAEAGTPVPGLCRQHASARQRSASGAASSATWTDGTRSAWFSPTGSNAEKPLCTRCTCRPTRSADDHAAFTRVHPSALFARIYRCFSCIQPFT